MMPSESSSDAESQAKRSRGSDYKEKKSKKDKKGKEDDKFDRLLAAQERHFMSLQSQMGAISGQVGTVQHSVQELKGDLNKFKDETDTRFTHVEERLKKLEETPPPQPAVVSLEPEAKAFMETGGRAAKGTPGWVPPGQRKVIIISGFEYDSDGDAIAKHVKSLLGFEVEGQELKFPGVVAVKPLGRLTSKVKVIFDTKDHMWNLLTKMKGKKFQRPDGKKLHHNIEKTMEEDAISKKVSLGLKAIREFCIEKGDVSSENAKDIIDGDYNLGYLFVRSPGVVVCRRLIERSKTDGKYTLIENAPQALPHLKEFAFDELLERMNTA